MKEYKDIFKYLDERNFKGFVSFVNSYEKFDFFYVLKFLISQGTKKKDFDRVRKFAEYIFIEAQGSFFGEPMHFEVNRDMEYFQEFIYFLNVFVVLKVPFEEWKILVIEAFKILEDLVNKGDFNYKRHPNFKSYTKKLNTIIDDIRKDPDMDRKFFDYLNGAL